VKKEEKILCCPFMKSVSEEKEPLDEINHKLKEKNEKDGQNLWKRTQP
jgi:hypothetical protein